MYYNYNMYISIINLINYYSWSRQYYVLVGFRTTFTKTIKIELLKYLYKV